MEVVVTIAEALRIADQIKDPADAALLARSGETLEACVVLARAYRKVTIGPDAGEDAPVAQVIPMTGR